MSTPASTKKLCLHFSTYGTTLLNNETSTPLSSKKSQPESIAETSKLQIEQLSALLQDLCKGGSISELLKQKMIEKAKVTLDDAVLPPPDKMLPFFHFDDCGDVHFSFLIHEPPYSPIYTIIESVFGAKAMDISREIYKIVYDAYLQSAGLNQENNYDVIVDVDYDEDQEPNFVIIPKGLCPARSDPNLMGIKKEISEDAPKQATVTSDSASAPIKSTSAQALMHGEAQKNLPSNSKANEKNEPSPIITRHSLRLSSRTSM